MIDARWIMKDPDLATTIAREHGITATELRAMATMEIRNARARIELAQRTASAAKAPAIPTAIDPIRARVLRVTATLR